MSSPVVGRMRVLTLGSLMIALNSSIVGHIYTLSSNTKERFIHFDLMVGKDARETDRNESILETRAKLLDSCRDQE